MKGTGTGIDFQSGAIVQLDRAEIVTASPDIIISGSAVNYLQPDGRAPVNDYGDKVYPSISRSTRARASSFTARSAAQIICTRYRRRKAVR